MPDVTPHSPTPQLVRHYKTGEYLKLSFSPRGDVALEPVSHANELQDSAPWIAPALLDIQMNGCGGCEFCDENLTESDVKRIAEMTAASGATRFLPTLTTQSDRAFHAALKTINRTCESDHVTARRIPGVHIEGPFISRNDGPRGAHPIEFCRPPDWDTFQRFQESAGGRLRIITLSPEYEGAAAIIEKAVASGVLVAIGHTAASPEQIHEAIEAGARLGTHLGNGCDPLLHRHRNCFWPQLADDRLTISLIADGRHLPQTALKTFLRAKSLERCVLISDMSGMAGLPPGVHPSRMGDVEVLEDGGLVVAGQRELLAGAARSLFEGIGIASCEGEIALADAVDLASGNPARLLGLPAAGFESDDLNDFIVFDFDPHEESGDFSPRLKYVVEAGRLIRD
jgi:N-acetylglucosamine-6-phosphate deacetylase